MATDEHILLLLGRKISELRTLKGATQLQMAEDMEFSPQYLQSVEAGNQNLTVSSLNKFAIYLGVEIGKLFDEPKSMERPVGRPPKNTM